MDWHARVRNSFASTPTTPDDDVLEELAQHAASVHESAVAAGATREEADRRVETLLEKWRQDARALKRRQHRPANPPPPPTDAKSLILGIAHDIRYACRVLLRQPRYVTLAVATLALGIGATTTIGSLTYNVLMKPLPWPTADRLVTLKETRGGSAPRFGSFSNAAYLAWRENAATIDEIAAWRPQTVTLGDGQESERVRAAGVTASLFRALAARPAAGVLFAESDEALPVVIISERLWQRRFAASPDAIGQSIALDGTAHTIVGVLPDALAYPDRQTQLWLPFRVPLPAGNLLSMFECIALLRPGVSAAQASAEGTARGRFAADTGLTTTAIFGTQGRVEVAARSLGEAVVADVRRPLLMLLVAAGLLLLVALTNVASLSVVRATARGRELAIRAALGASRLRIARQIAVESVLIGCCGGLAGTVLAWGLLRSSLTLLPTDFPRLPDATGTGFLAGPLVAFAVVVSVVAGIAIGWVPIYRMRRGNLAASIGSDGRAPAGTVRPPVARARLVVVTVQIAVACVLLIGAVLMIRSFTAMLNADRGYEPGQVLSARVALPSSLFSPARRREVLGNVLARLLRAATVRAAAFTTESPLTPGGSTSSFTLPARDGSTAVTLVQAAPRIVSPGYFATLGLDILAGRSLADTDSETSEPVAVVNETFRRNYLGERALGVRVPMSMYQTGMATIVGVSEDVRYIGAATPTLPEIYFSFRQLKVGVQPAIATLLVRGTADPLDLANGLRQAVVASDRSLVPEGVMTLESRLLAGNLARPRLYAAVLGGFATLALMVTAVGLFGVLSYTVAERTRELGVRAALGASRGRLLMMILKQSLSVTAAGICVGLLVSIWLTRFAGSVLYGVTPTDVVTYAVVPALVTVIALAASLAPAVRAAKLDPLIALRSGS